MVKNWPEVATTVTVTINMKLLIILMELYSIAMYYVGGYVKNAYSYMMSDMSACMCIK